MFTCITVAGSGQCYSLTKCQLMGFGLKKNDLCGSSEDFLVGQVRGFESQSQVRDLRRKNSCVCERKVTVAGWFLKTQTLLM